MTANNSTENLIQKHGSILAFFNITADNTTLLTTSQYINGSSFWSSMNLAYVIIGVFGIIGNLFSCVVIISYPPLRKRLANYFIVHQSFLDSLIALTMMINVTLEYNLHNVSGPSFYAACYLVYTRIFYTSVFAASTWNLTALAIERYMKIVHAVRHKASLTKTKIVSTCVAIWIFSLLYRSIATLLPVSVSDGVCRVPSFRNAASKTAQGTSLFLLDFLLPMCTIAFCYVQIMLKLRKVNATSTTSSSVTSGVRRNIITLLVIVSLVFLITVGPRQMMILYYTIAKLPVDINDSTFLICLCLNYSNCSINPIIYIFKYDDFQKGVMTLLGIRKGLNTSFHETGVQEPSGNQHIRVRVATTDQPDCLSALR